MKHWLVMAAVVLGAGFAIGCGSQQTTRDSGRDYEVDAYAERERGGWFSGSSDRQRPITAADVRRDASPELSTVARRPGESKNDRARAIDTTTRQAWDDLNNLLFFDRPVRLSSYPIP